MKKVLISMALALTMLSGLTAEIYRGDIQFQMGYSANDITYQDNVPSFETDNCNFGIQTWHLFGPSEFVKAGFMVNTEWGIGNSRPNSTITNSQFLFNNYSLIGPAAALDLFGVVRFNFDSPVLGIWAKPNAPYVCIEPWWGINDNHDKKADLSEKRGIMSLNPNEDRIFSWCAEITE